jgi:putative ABC transport system permease protein
MHALLEDLTTNPLTQISALITLLPVAAGFVFVAVNPKLFLLIVKNLRRNLLRTGLTCLAIMVLVFMVSLIWTVVFTLDQATTEKSKDLKLVVTERWKVPSMMPPTHGYYLNPSKPQFLSELKPLGIGPDDFMSWSFYGGTLEQGAKITRESLVFFFVMDPSHVRSMMDDLQDVDPALIKKMQEKRNGILMGRNRMATINRKVGERFKIYSINYKDIDLEFEIVGQLPEGRYNDGPGIMNDAYFNDELEKYARAKGRKHPLDQQRLNLIWLRVRDRDTYERAAHVIESASEFADRPVKCETASSGIGAWLDAYRDLLWGVKYLLVPAMLVSMALVVANAISISVRERRPEMAVLKVLGYRPRQILGLVLGESLLVGGLSGLIAAGVAFGVFNGLYGGLPFRIAFFPVFRIPEQVLFWGMAMGFSAAMLGSFFPAWSARSVKVSEVFAKVA